MRKVSSDDEFRRLCRAGHGMIYTKFSNVLHAANCSTLATANGKGKLYFENAHEAKTWLQRSRPSGWSDCPFCSSTPPQQKQEPHSSPVNTALEQAYAVFHLQPSAPLDVAETVYKASMKRAHPDAGGTDEDARKLTQAIETIRKHK